MVALIFKIKHFLLHVKAMESRLQRNLPTEAVKKWYNLFSVTIQIWKMPRICVSILSFWCSIVAM